MAVVMLKMTLPAKQELSEYVLLWCCLSTPVDCALGSKHGIYILAWHNTEMSEKVTKLKLHKMKDNIALITIVPVNYLVIVWPVRVLHPVDLVPLPHVHVELLCYAILTQSLKFCFAFYFNTVSRLLILYNFIYLDNYLLQDSHECSAGKSWCIVIRIYTLWSFEPCQTHLHVSLHLVLLLWSLLFDLVKNGVFHSRISCM